MAYDAGAVDLHASIECRMQGKRMKTTVGRVLLKRDIAGDKMAFDSINVVMDKKALKNLVAHCYREAGTKATVILADRLKGSWATIYSTRSGLSISIKDMVIPSSQGGDHRPRHG